MLTNPTREGAPSIGPVPIKRSWNLKIFARIEWKDTSKNPTAFDFFELSIQR